jgi:hypothetical protein
MSGEKRLPKGWLEVLRTEMETKVHGNTESQFINGYKADYTRELIYE